MPADVQACRVAIAGASSLGGKELKQLIEDNAFPAAEIRLLDEELAAGRLTEAGGEPVVIQTVDEGSFERVRFAFFTGSPAFTARHWEAAHRAGATVVDLSGGLADVPSARRWIPALDAVLPPPSPKSDVPAAGLFLSPPAPVIVTCSLGAAFSGFSLERPAVGLQVGAPNEPAPSNVRVAGESRILLSQAERDPNVERGYWFWGAADNLRLAAVNAIRIAEKLLAS